MSKCEKEGIDSFGEYDKKYKIHYRSREWFSELVELLQENNRALESNSIMKKIQEVILKFSIS